MNENEKPELPEVPTEKRDALTAPVEASAEAEREPASSAFPNLTEQTQAESEAPLFRPGPVGPLAIPKKSKKAKVTIIILIILLILIVAGAGTGAYFAKQYYDDRINQQTAEIERLQNASENDLKSVKDTNQTLTDENQKLQDEKTKLEEENEKLTEEKADLQKQIDDSADTTSQDSSATNGTSNRNRTSTNMTNDSSESR